METVTLMTSCKGVRMLELCIPQPKGPQTGLMGHVKAVCPSGGRKKGGSG